MAVSGLHHVNIRTTDLDETRKFYEDIVGLHVGTRPDFAGDGIWLYAGAHPWVHVSVADAADNDRGREEGFGHIAFAASGMKELTDKLEANGIKYELRASPGRELAQLFFHDPSGVHLEFTCPLVIADSEGVDVPDR